MNKLIRKQSVMPVTEIAAATDHDQLPYFLAAIAIIDAEMQRFHRLDQAGLLPEFITPEYESEIIAVDRPAWAVQGGNWQSTTPEFSLTLGSRLAQLTEQYRLTNFELAVVLIGCLNSFEPRYRQLIAMLPFQREGRPTLELVINLFCPGPYARYAQLQSLASNASLQRYGLIELHPVSTAGHTVYETPKWVWRWLMGDCSLPESLLLVARWLEPQGGDAALDQPILTHPLPTLLEVRFAPGADGEASLSNLAQSLQTRALLVSWSHLLADDRNSIKILDQLLGIARLWKILLVFNLDSHNAEDPGSRLVSLAQQLEQRITQAGEDDYPVPLGCLLPIDSPIFPFPTLSRHTLSVELPDADTRYAQLLTLLDEEPDEGLLSLVRQVALSRQEMHYAVREAHASSQLRGNSLVNVGDYREAFLRRSRKDFGRLAQRITPQRTWDDIIISDALQEELAEITQAIRWRESVLKKGFARKVGRATGISALFHGNPGTGKTLVAEVLAAELGVDLIRVDLSTVVNKYIGETEKNLGRIFDLAAQDAGVLFFDEADALFGKRSETKDSKDRHANIEIAYLLQRLEQHPGLVILATNNRSHLDDAFTRRFTFITYFVWPDADLREKMWRSAWPVEQSLAPNIDFSRLAQVQLTGSNIRNIALLATWLAGGAPCVEQAHIEQALRREMAKMGRNL